MSKHLLLAGALVFYWRLVLLCSAAVTTSGSANSPPAPVRRFINGGERVLHRPCRSAGRRPRPAVKNLTEVTRLVPQEPAGWANLGILQLRQNNFEEAAKSLEQARQLAPQKRPHRRNSRCSQ
jgi:cytochrome c-type biogenesis protein CcmH/NrfG